MISIVNFDANPAMAAITVIIGAAIVKIAPITIGTSKYLSPF